MNAKKNILVAITILMVCVFSLVSCDIMGIEIPFLSNDDTTEEPTTDVPAAGNTGSDDASSSQDDATTTPKPETTTPKKPTTTPKPTTTEKKPSTTEPTPGTTEPTPGTTEPTPGTTEPVPPVTTTPPIVDNGADTKPGYGPIGIPKA